MKKCVRLNSLLLGIFVLCFVVATHAAFAETVLTVHDWSAEVSATGNAQALAQTAELLRQDRVTLFEAAIAHGPFLVRVDILRKNGDTVDLIEVKAKSFSSRNPHAFRAKRGGLNSGMLPYLQDRSIDWSRSAMVGDRVTDISFAENLRIRGFQLRTEQFGGEWDWSRIAHALADAPRCAVVQRNTKETKIHVEVDLDRVAEPKTNTGLPFFDHMLEQIGKHGGFALVVEAQGDLQIDEHHTVEDTGLALGQALKEALGDKRGISRYGFTLPMDETLASAALDFSGRPYFVFSGEFKRERVGDLPTELVPHFFRSLCDASGLNLNLQVQGDNDHHKIEACFKAFARALRQSIRREGADLPSTKGAL